MAKKINQTYAAAFAAGQAREFNNSDKTEWISQMNIDGVIVTVMFKKVA